MQRHLIESLVVSAAGTSGVEFDPRDVDIQLQRVPVCRSGVATRFSEKELKGKLDARECLIRFALKGKGTAETRFFTCDFTKGYIDINASYRT